MLSVMDRRIRVAFHFMRERLKKRRSDVNVKLKI